MPVTADIRQRCLHDGVLVSEASSPVEYRQHVAGLGGSSHDVGQGHGRVVGDHGRVDHLTVGRHFMGDAQWSRRRDRRSKRRPMGDVGERDVIDVPASRARLIVSFGEVPPLGYELPLWLCRRQRFVACRPHARGVVVDCDLVDHAHPHTRSQHPPAQTPVGGHVEQGVAQLGSEDLPEPGVVDRRLEPEVARLGRKAAEHIAATIGSMLQDLAVDAFPAVASGVVEEPLEVFGRKASSSSKGAIHWPRASQQRLVVGRHSGNTPPRRPGQMDKGPRRPDCCKRSRASPKLSTTSSGRIGAASPTTTTSQALIGLRDTVRVIARLSELVIVERRDDHDTSGSGPRDAAKYTSFDRYAPRRSAAMVPRSESTAGSRGNKAVSRAAYPEDSIWADTSARERSR